MLLVEIDLVGHGAQSNWRLIIFRYFLFAIKYQELTNKEPINNKKNHLNMLKLI